jgi:hypothetical protein
MGSFTDSLLKLTEFPFSYSLIALLVLIFSPPPTDQSLPIEQLNSTNQSLDELDLSDNELSFLERYGPLLVVMGFVATTLSIADPIGRLQKGFLLLPDFRRFLLNFIPSYRSSVTKHYFDAIQSYMKIVRLIPYSLSNRQIFGKTLNALVPERVLISLLSDFESILGRTSRPKELKAPSDVDGYYF